MLIHGYICAVQLLNHNNIDVSDTHIKLNSPYTVDLVSELRKTHISEKLFLLLGSDVIGEFSRFKDYDDIPKQIDGIICVRRKNEHIDNNLPIVATFASPSSLSSTLIRRLLKQKNYERLKELYWSRHDLLDEIAEYKSKTD